MSLVILDGTVRIPDNFGARSDITEPPIIPDSVREIGEWFLYGCTSLTQSPKLPE